MAVQSLKRFKTFEGITEFWEHESRETKTKMKFSTFVPSGEIKGCLIWLSGLTCNEENFISKAGAQRVLEQHGLMVICPDTSPRGLNLPYEHDSWDFGSGASFYVDATTKDYAANYRMESYVFELHELVQDQFKVAADRISIFGHSMGGHGALVLGLRQPNKFRSVSAFSPIVNPVKVAWGEKAFTGYLGEDRAVWKNYDATELIKAGKRHPRTILLDQGSKDEFLEKQLLTENFITACWDEGQSLNAHFRESYDHSYYFIASFVEAHIAFHAEALAAPKT